MASHNKTDSQILISIERTRDLREIAVFINWEQETESWHRTFKNYLVRLTNNRPWQVKAIAALP